MTDLVERLRQPPASLDAAHRRIAEAADEISRLRDVKRRALRLKRGYC